jgi:glycosyltransferase involved in cell wall biosynthesis
MKIVVVQDAVDTPGGVEAYLASVVPALRDRGHSLALLYLQRRGGPPLIAGFDGPSIAVGSDLESAVGALRAWGAELAFANNMSSLDVEERVLAEWPVVKFMHGYFGTCVSALKMHAFPQRVACDRVLGAGCMALYFPRRCGPFRPSAIVRGIRFATRERRLLPRYSAIVVGSAHMKREFERHGATRVALVPQFTTSPAGSPGAGGHTVLFLGRMTGLKGGDLLVRATGVASRRAGRSLPLVMAGDGPQREEWERLARDQGVAAEFPGWLSGADRDRAIAHAAVLVVPSVWPEPFGLVGLEAAAHGVPAIAFDVGGIRQWLHHRRNGLLVPPAGGAEALGAAIHEVMADDALRQRFGEAALAVAGEMSLDAHIAQLEQVLLQARQPEGRR